MFDFDSFMAGEQAIMVYERSQFDQFRVWASRHGLVWQNGADPASEALSPTADGTFVSNTNARRYVSNRACAYVIINGRLSQRQRCYAYNHNMERIDWRSLPDETQVDEDGFEVENFLKSLDISFRF